MYRETINKILNETLKNGTRYKIITIKFVYLDSTREILYFYHKVKGEVGTTIRLIDDDGSYLIKIPDKNELDELDRTFKRDDYLTYVY